MKSFKTLLASKLSDYFINKPKIYFSAHSFSQAVFAFTFLHCRSYVIHIVLYFLNCVYLVEILFRIFFNIHIIVFVHCVSVCQFT